MATGSWWRHWWREISPSTWIIWNGSPVWKLWFGSGETWFGALILAGVLTWPAVGALARGWGINGGSYPGLDAGTGTGTVPWEQSIATPGLPLRLQVPRRDVSPRWHVVSDHPGQQRLPGQRPRTARRVSMLFCDDLPAPLPRGRPWLWLGSYLGFAAERPPEPGSVAPGRASESNWRRVARRPLICARPGQASYNRWRSGECARFEGPPDLGACRRGAVPSEPGYQRDAANIPANQTEIKLRSKTLHLFFVSRLPIVHCPGRLLPRMIGNIVHWFIPLVRVHPGRRRLLQVFPTNLAAKSHVFYPELNQKKLFLSERKPQLDGKIIGSCLWYDRIPPLKIQVTLKTVAKCPPS